MVSRERYTGVILPRFWEESRHLSMEARAFAAYLSTCGRNAGVPGYMVAGALGLADELNVSPEDVEGWLTEIEARLPGFMERDEEGRVIRLPNQAEKSHQPNQQVIAAWWRAWCALPASPLKLRHVESLRRCLPEAPKPVVVAAWSRTFGSVTVVEGVTVDPSRAASEAAAGRVVDLGGSGTGHTDVSGPVPAATAATHEAMAIAMETGAVTPPATSAVEGSLRGGTTGGATGGATGTLRVRATGSSMGPSTGAAAGEPTGARTGGSTDPVRVRVPVLQDSGRAGAGAGARSQATVQEPGKGRGRDRDDGSAHVTGAEVHRQHGTERSSLSPPSRSGADVAVPRLGHRSSPPTPTGRAAWLAEYRDVAERLWELQEQLRHDVMPGCRALRATDDRLEAIAALLAAGATEADCEHVLRVRADDVRADEKQGGWFNGISNWTPNSFKLAVGRPLPKRSGARRSLPADYLLQLAGDEP